MGTAGGTAGGSVELSVTVQCHTSVMLMTHLPETRASNPALETCKCDMLSSAGFYLARESSVI